MTEVMRRKNALVSEGRLLATGKRGQLMAEEWLYLYSQVNEDDLVGPQAVLLAGFESRIRSRYQRLIMDTVAF